ncbi:MAG TPA: hypothetical protein VLU96_11025 [Gaiellaceae bacterium]|nr:hypothetical protein [Gaiellaceae bacterium]
MPLPLAGLAVLSVSTAAAALAGGGAAGRSTPVTLVRAKGLITAFAQDGGRIGRIRSLLLPA